MRVLFVSNVPSPYVVSYLNELGRLAQVTAVFETGSSTERDRSWEQYDADQFRCVILKGIRTGKDMAFSPGVVRYLHAFRRDRIILSNPSTPTGILAILFCKLYRIPYILQSEGGFAKDGRGLKEKLKTFLMKDACLYLSGMSLKNEYFLAYGARPQEVRQYPFTSLHRKDLAAGTAAPEEKQALRRKNGVEGDFLVVYAGRIEDAKGVDVLLEACRDLKPGIRVIMIGGEPTEAYRAAIQHYGLQNTEFLPFLLPDRLREYYRMADVLVLPTRGDTWGLVINEGMAQGLPVISTDSCVAALELIEEGVNGYVVPTGDAPALAERINRLASDPVLAESMGRNSLRTIERYTVETMAAEIYGYLEEYESKESGT